MNWEMLSAIGQLVSARGVIPSLIYLAIQIREQNKERRRGPNHGMNPAPSNLIMIFPGLGLRPSVSHRSRGRHSLAHSVIARDLQLRCN